MASGTVLAQAVVLAFAPLITRIYSPEVFGLQGVFLSLVGILSPVIALRYPMAIITAETGEEALRLARLSLLIAGASGSMLTFVLLASGQALLPVVGAQGLGPLILFLPLALFCVALQDVTEFLAARSGVFRVVGVVAVLQAFVTNLARVLGGLIAPVAASLVTVTAIAPAVKAGMLRIGARDLRQPVSGLSRPQAIALLLRHRDFPVYRMPTDVLNALSQAVPVLMLAALFSPTAAGLYALARTVLNLPSNVIGASIGNVLYARFAELSRDGQPLMPLLLHATGALLAFTPIIIGLAWFAPPVFAFVFGEEWREAGHYAQWMALWLGVAVANVPAVRLSPIIGAQNTMLVASILILSVRMAAMAVVASTGGGAMTAVAAFSVVSLLGSIALIFSIYLRCRRFEYHKA